MAGCIGVVVIFKGVCFATIRVGAVIIMTFHIRISHCGGISMNMTAAIARIFFYITASAVMLVGARAGGSSFDISAYCAIVGVLTRHFGRLHVTAEIIMRIMSARHFGRACLPSAGFIVKAMLAEVRI